MLPRVPGEPPPDLSRPITEVKVRIGDGQAGLRLDRALAALFPWRTRSSIQRLIREDRVRVLADREGDACPARASRRVREGDLVLVRVPRRPVPAGTPDRTAWNPRILFEDRWLVAIDKPPGMAVHPSGRRLGGTLINFLHARYRNLDRPERDVVPRLCHRLDRETSGLILCAKEPRAHSEIRKQFEANTVRKSYLAVVEGRPRDDVFLVDAAIGPALNSRIRLKMSVRADGQDSLTAFEVLRRSGELSLLLCRPRTGRQHQIRVHLAHVGHPLVGDKLYGPDEEWFLRALEGPLPPEILARLRLPRQALHSHRLELRHPMGGEPLVLESPLPPDMEALLGPSS